MNYREFGKTGEKISALGFGCMRLPEYEKDGKMFVDLDKSAEKYGVPMESMLVQYNPQEFSICSHIIMFTI